MALAATSSLTWAVMSTRTSRWLVLMVIVSCIDSTLSRHRHPAFARSRQSVQVVYSGLTRLHKFGALATTYTYWIVKITSYQPRNVLHSTWVKLVGMIKNSGDSDLISPDFLFVGHRILHLACKSKFNFVICPTSSLPAARSGPGHGRRPGRSPGPLPPGGGSHSYGISRLPARHA